MAIDLDAHSSTHRLEAFSDGVFAIAITLLIIEIGVPHVDGDATLAHELRDLWPSYFAYALSFLMIGIYWANHHSFMQMFKRTDHGFLMVNVIFLMAIAFLPFPTAVLGEYLKEGGERQDAVTFYAFGLLLPATGWLTVWLYARARGLMVDGLDPGYLRFTTIQYVLSSLVYAVAMVVSLVEPWVALAGCTGLMLLYTIPPLRPRFVDQRR